MADKKGKGKLYPEDDDGDKGKRPRSSSPQAETAMGSSENTNKGGVHNLAGTLDSNAEEEDSRPMKSTKMADPDDANIGLSRPYGSPLVITNQNPREVPQAQNDAWGSADTARVSSEDTNEGGLEGSTGHQDTNEGGLEGFTGNPDSNSDAGDELMALRLGQPQQQRIMTAPPGDSDSELEELIFGIHLTDPARLVIPFGTATRYFAKLISDQEKINFSDHNQHWFMDLTYDDKAQSYAISKGLSLYVEHYELKPPDLIQAYVLVKEKKINNNHFYIKHKKLLGLYLFDVCVLRSNKLAIPCNLEVMKFFSPQKALPPPDHLAEFPLNLIDHCGKIWDMRFICYENEEAYVVYRGWENYVARYGLNYKDSVRFFEWINNTEKNSFVIFKETGAGPEARDNSSPPMFVETNYVCGLELKPEDVALNRLEMRGVQLAFQCRGREMVKLTDKNYKNWYVIILQLPDNGGYVIEDGWDAVLREHELREGDDVKLYTPEGADHDQHFLIQLTKKPRVEVTKSAGTGSGSHKGKEKV